MKLEILILSTVLVVSALVVMVCEKSVQDPAKQDTPEEIEAAERYSRQPRVDYIPIHTRNAIFFYPVIITP